MFLIVTVSPTYCDRDKTTSQAFFLGLDLSVQEAVATRC